MSVSRDVGREGGLIRPRSLEGPIHNRRYAPILCPELPAPFGELRTYPGVDHFDIYDDPEHEAVVADETAFLRSHLF